MLEVGGIYIPEDTGCTGIWSVQQFYGLCVAFGVIIYFLLNERYTAYTQFSRNCSITTTIILTDREEFRITSTTPFSPSILTLGETGNPFLGNYFLQTFFIGCCIIPARSNGRNSHNTVGSSQINDFQSSIRTIISNNRQRIHKIRRNRMTLQILINTAHTPFSKGSSYAIFVIRLRRTAGIPSAQCCFCQQEIRLCRRHYNTRRINADINIGNNCFITIYQHIQIGNTGTYTQNLITSRTVFQCHFLSNTKLFQTRIIVTT